MSQDFKVRYMFSLTEEARWPEHSPVLPKLVGQALWKLEAVGDDIWLPTRCNPERVFRKEQWTMVKMGEEFRIMQSKRGYLRLRKEVLPEGITFEQSMNPFMRDNGSGSTEVPACAENAAGSEPDLRYHFGPQPIKDPYLQAEIDSMDSAETMVLGQPTPPKRQRLDRS